MIPVHHRRHRRDFLPGHPQIHRGVAHLNHAVPDVDAIIAALVAEVHHGDHVVFMSNGGFEAAPRRFLAALSS